MLGDLELCCVVCVVAIYVLIEFVAIYVNKN